MCNPIKEMEVDSGSKIVFSPLSSCLTITCVLADGNLVGIHLVHDKKKEIPKTMQKAKKIINKETVTGIYVIGVLSCWKDLAEVITQKVMDPLGVKCHADFKATSGQSETVTIKIKNDKEITVTVVYPEGKDKTKWSGTHDLPRICKDPHDSDED